MKTVFLLSLTSLLAASAAMAHTMNVVPSHYVQSKTGGFVTVDLFASNMTFQADKGIAVDAFKVVLPDGTVAKPAAAVQGKRKSIADVALPVAGTYRLEMGGQPRFFTSYSIGGEQKRLMGDKQKAAKELPKDATNIVTTQGRNRALAFITVNAPTDTVLKTSGQGLEFSFDRHPADIVAGEALTVTLTLNGKPAAGLKAELSFDGEVYRNDPARQHLTADANGKISFTPAQSGRYLLEASAEMMLKSAQADKIREGFSLSFEAALP